MNVTALAVVVVGSFLFISLYVMERFIHKHLTEIRERLEKMDRLLEKIDRDQNSN